MWSTRPGVGAHGWIRCSNVAGWDDMAAVAVAAAASAAAGTSAVLVLSSCGSGSGAWLGREFMTFTKGEVG